MQVSVSKKWESKPAQDEDGQVLRSKSGKSVLKKSYSVLQDDFFHHMRAVGYTDVERGERGSSEEHLTIAQFRVERERERLAGLTEQTQQKVQEVASLEKKMQKMQRQQTSVQKIDQIEVKPVPLSSKVMLERSDYETLTAATQKYIIQEKRESRLQKVLDVAHKLIGELKAQVAALTAELSKNKSIRSKLNSVCLEQENEELQSKVQQYESVIDRQNLWHLFGRGRVKTHSSDDVC